MSENLVKKLQQADEAYYNSSTPLMSDEEYDALRRELELSSPEDPYLEVVGAPPTNGVAREYPMGTLSKVYTKEGLESWMQDVQGDYLICPKYDGFGVELLYKEGLLVQAMTRGDGMTGDLVTEAMSEVVPTRLDSLGSFTVRGEAIVPRSNHGFLRDLGYTAMRNAVPGIVRSNNQEALKYVDFVAYEFIDGRDSRSEQRSLYSGVFNIESTHRVKTREEVFSMIEELTSLRDTMKYEIDGIVIKTDVIDKDDDYLRPKTQIAWKFKSAREVTTLRGIEYQLGATGKFTPIGIFDPVEFQGATLTRASLGNIVRLTGFQNKASVGSMIEVSRRGDIIPYIEDILSTEEGKEFPPLTVCPHCETPLKDVEGEPQCVNKSCPEILRLKISQYVAGVKVKGLGQSAVEKLISAGYNKVSKLYKLDEESLNKIQGLGPSAISKVLEFVEKPLTPLQFLTYYPFEDLGESVWKSILSKYTLNDLVYNVLYEEDFQGIKGLGPGKISQVTRQLHENKQEIKDILATLNMVP